METEDENEDIKIWEEHAHMTCNGESIEELVVWEYDKDTDDESPLTRRRRTKVRDVELRVDDSVDDVVHKGQ